MFHIGMWRERMRNALNDVKEGRDYQRPPANTDEFNDAELANGIGTPLADASARADHLLAEIIELYDALGDRPFEWNISVTTTEAVLRNSYTHPQNHLFDYYRENGMTERAIHLREGAVDDLKKAEAPPTVLGAVVYNLACARVLNGQTDEAIDLLKEAAELRRDVKETARYESVLAPLRDDPRFQELVNS